MRNYSVLAVVILLPLFMTAQRTLIWSDEFNTDGLPDATKWSYDLGAGGWGNNEYQNYTNRYENARVEGGNLVIEARKDWYNGIEYSSARIVTANKGDFTYGRVEARAKLPGGLGAWSAIWMLPTDWEYGNWPNSGEIDIMEHVAYEPNIVYGTIHTQAFNHTIGTQIMDSYTAYDFESAFHTYAVEWTATNLEFSVDGVVYQSIAKQAGWGSAEWPFDKRFHLILNLAVGGDWGAAGGFDPDAWPRQMLVDYIRVYSPDTGSGGSTATTNLPGTAEAENYSAMSGIQTETCSEGGQNLGYIDAGDWMSYDVNVTEGGEYTVEYRVASANGGVLNLEKDAGTKLLGTLNIPNTGGWQKWQSVTQTITLAAGAQSLGISTSTGGFNLNWIKFTKVNSGTSTTIQIEAEDYVAMSGIQTETCSEGGLNVGYIDANDWLSYAGITIPKTGVYSISYRVASQSGGGVFRFEKDEGTTLLNTVSVPSTGGWQKWQTVTQEVTLPAGTYSVGVGVSKGGFNLNWINISASKKSKAVVDVSFEKTSLVVYPSPVRNTLNIQGADTDTNYEIYTVFGTKVAQQRGRTFDASALNAGIYLIRVGNLTQRFVKQ